MSEGDNRDTEQTGSNPPSCSSRGYEGDRAGEPTRRRRRGDSKCEPSVSVEVKEADEFEGLPEEEEEFTSSDSSDDNSSEPSVSGDSDDSDDEVDGVIGMGNDQDKPQPKRRGEDKQNNGAQIEVQEVDDGRTVEEGRSENVVVEEPPDED